MKVIQFVANISYNDIFKLFSVLWDENAFENLLRAVVQEFEIPPNEATEKILCDLDGTSHTKDSFEEIVCRSISEGKVPQFRVITLALSDNTVTSSTNRSEYKESIEQQETALNSRVSNLFSNMRRFEDNLNKAENKFMLFKTKIESNILNIQGEPHMPESKVDIEALQLELENRKVELNLYQKALLEFESRLKEKENSLNQEDHELNELRKRLNRRDEKLKNREEKIICEESDLALRHYSLNKLHDILHGVSSDMNAKRQQLNQQELGLHLRKSMFDEEKNKLKTGSRIVIKSKGQGCKMELDANPDEKEAETKINEGASTSNQNTSQKLSVRVRIELNPKMINQKRRGSASSGNSDEQQDKPRGPKTPPIDEQAMSMNFNEPSTSDDQPMKVNNRQTARKYKTKKLSH